MTADVQLSTTQNSYTRQWLQVIIITDVVFYQAIYYSSNQRNYKVCGMWTSTDCLEFDKSACSVKCK